MCDDCSCCGGQLGWTKVELGGGVAFDGGCLVDGVSPVGVARVHDGIGCGSVVVASGAVGCIASKTRTKS